MTTRPTLSAAGAGMLALLSSACAIAEVRLPAVISDHMVLQRSAAVPVWGWATPGEQVSVQFGSQARAVRTGADGRWRVELDLTRATAEPASLTVRGADNTLNVEDVLVGEVWLASGQSNMDKPLGAQRGQQPTFNAEAEIAAAQHPDIRLFKVTRARTAEPGEDVKGSWVRCSPASVEATRFSAAAYYFGRRLKEELHTPVGLIDASFGGTRIESWTPAAALAAQKTTQTAAQKAVENEAAPARAPFDPKDRPASLYNGMIAGLAPFALKGVLWYQGESNILDTDDGPAYTGKMEALISSWRTHWRSEFPFYYVQVAPHLYSSVRADRVPGGTESAPRLWEAQADALRIPNTAMIGTTDLVDDLRDIHPRDKKSVGLRLANLALAKTYGRTGLQPFSPAYRAVRFDGGKAILSFEHAAGLAARDGKPLTWFEIAGADGAWHPADALIDGDRVVVSSALVASPRSVRFAWHEAAQPNLVNGAGLPALPFRSEHPIARHGWSGWGWAGGGRGARAGGGGHPPPPPRGLAPPRPPPTPTTTPPRRLRDSFAAPSPASTSWSCRSRSTPGSGRTDLFLGNSYINVLFRGKIRPCLPPISTNTNRPARAGHERVCANRTTIAPDRSAHARVPDRSDAAGAHDLPPAEDPARPDQCRPQAI
jgi:sialate O-acetylesterase